jgi:hypothetical protein
LGFEAVGLGLDAAEGLTLAQLVAEGRLSSPPKATRYMLPEDGTGKAATALGWMHANCGNSCHNRYEAAGATFMGLWLRLSAAPLLRPAGPSASSVDATTTDTYQTTVNQLPKLGSFLSDSRWKRIVPGKPEQSQLFEMVRLPRDAAATTMPPLGMRTHDTLAIEALRAWIAAMPAAGPHP